MKRRQFLRKAGASRRLPEGRKFRMVFMVLILAVIMVFNSGTSAASAAGGGSRNDGSRSGSVFPAHEPYGTGIGAMPGRVVWFYDRDAVDWDGSGYWWETGNFKESAVQEMVDRGIASLAGKEDARAGWNALFLAHNSARGKTTPYTRGEKIAIKANINGSGVFDDDSSGETKMSYTNPVLLKCLLRSLVNEAGVAPCDITVYDVSRIFPDYMIELCTEGELSGVRFAGRNEGTADTDAPINWSYSFSGAVNYLPTCVTEAEYLINLANLKGHSYGITLCAKNHFGSFINGNAMRPPEGANLHQWLTKNEMGIYSPLVDLMGNDRLGKKTVLYLLDALICAPSEGTSITKENSTWLQAPFSGDYTSSIFLSQDPVAIDSVGADFLMNEPAVTENNSSLRGNPNVENYLHEAGLAAAAPSGNVYYDGNGRRLENLGVHEHWNNPENKQYSRNLGKDEGIELVSLTPEKNKNILVAYFSCTETTKTLAEYASELLESDCYRIVPEVPYTEEDLAYYTGGRADQEQNDPSARPAISGKVEDMSAYDTIILGYPIWHGQAPRIISTFLESYDFSDKTIIPFCTSQSSGIGQSAKNLHELCPDSVKWAEGKRFGAGTPKEEIERWLTDIGILMPDKEECTGVTLNRSEITFTGAGETAQLTAVIALENAANKEVIWSSSDKNIATVSETGLVTAVSNGTCAVTVTTKDGGKTAECKVTVDIPTQPKPDNPELEQPENPSPENTLPPSGRIAGTSRYGTALACAEHMRSSSPYTTTDGKFTAAVVACADNFPDALAGSTLAASVHAPILLVGKSESGTEETLKYISENVDKEGKIYLLGGTSAIPERVASSLGSYGFKTENIETLAGSSRYETNLKIVDELAVEEGTDIVIVSGKTYADSLSVSGIAGAKRMPIFLAAGTLSEEAVRRIERIAPEHIYVIGGTAAVSEEAFAQAENLCASGSGGVVRIAGTSRYATSLAVAEYFGMDKASTAVFAYGGDFPDGLTGGAFAAGLNAPVILVSDGNYKEQEAFLQNSSIEHTYIMGGTAAISDETIGHLIK